MNNITLFCAADSLPGFTTLLQGGIFLYPAQGTTIIALLASLPGFTEEYARSRIETIFLDGLPADDLEQQLFGSELVLALSAAMPGLAGAIFRKGGVHASLRTETAAPAAAGADNDQPVTVRLKLFNVVARDRGKEILAAGCVLPAAALEKFFAYRPPLLAAAKRIIVDKKAVSPVLLAKTLHSAELITLTVAGDHDDT